MIQRIAWFSGRGSESDQHMGMMRPVLTPAIQRGFTLMEIMVVTAIIAIGAAAVAIAWPDQRLRQLEREGDRLAALLEAARMHSRASGRPLRWSPTSEGFQFEGAAPHFVTKLPTHWESQGIRAFTDTPVVLGPEPLLTPTTITLIWQNQPDLRIQVATNGLLPFAVSGP